MQHQGFFPIYPQGAFKTKISKKYRYFWLYEGYVPDFFRRFSIYFVEKIYNLSFLFPLPGM
jgi:hypothetical protein